MHNTAGGRRLFRVLAALLAAGILGSCGIEDYPYLLPVDPGIPLTLNTQAFIRFPGGQPYYFNYYVIYYRIYISGLPVEGTVSVDQLSQINSALSADYNALLSYTDTDNTAVPGNMGTIFANRKYYQLTLEGESIERMLGSGSLNVVTLDFARPSPARPAFFFGDTRANPAIPSVNLWRYAESGFMNPYANNRYFTNGADLNTAGYINETTFTNLDVAANAAASGPLFTYVSLYVMAYGTDNNFSPVYSAPTFVGVFRLPD